MRARAHIQKQLVRGTALLSLLLLACGPLNQWQQLTRQQQAVATTTARLGQSGELVSEAYGKLQTLPGYRLESRRVERNEAGDQTSTTLITEYDGQGNLFVQTEATELYFVEGRTYLFDPHYAGWVDFTPVLPAELRQSYDDDLSLTTLTHLLSRLGTVPIETGQETVGDRLATRYRLRGLVTEISQTLGQEAPASLDLRGTLWIDETSGALLKTEISIYRADSSQPIQEFELEVSNIGQIRPITVPGPVVDPARLISATATAQAWTVQPVVLEHQGQMIDFELIPVGVTQTPNALPRQAEVRLILRKLPEQLFRGARLEPFLAQLQHQLSLGLPRRNLVVTSSGYRLNQSDSQNQEAEVIYLFKADLEDFSHAELVIAGLGNPLFAPVAVEQAETRN